MRATALPRGRLRGKEGGDRQLRTRTASAEKGSKPRAGGRPGHEWGLSSPAPEKCPVPRDGTACPRGLRAFGELWGQQSAPPPAPGILRLGPPCSLTSRSGSRRWPFCGSGRSGRSGRHRRPWTSCSSSTRCRSGTDRPHARPFPGGFALWLRGGHLPSRKVEAGRVQIQCRLKCEPCRCPEEEGAAAARGQLSGLHTDAHGTFWPTTDLGAPGWGDR